MPRIGFIHPDLGIGGAEKAMVDAALALKKSGHVVEFITSHHDPTHCFPETANGTFKVTVAGDWFPRSVFGKFYALCAYIRMFITALYLVFFHGSEFDLIICDQISACIPVLLWMNKPILFYCHFPDLLLTQRKTSLKSLYRLPIDWVEEFTTGKADKVVVNSNFTAGVFRSTFKSLAHINPEVVYPIPNFEALDLVTGDLSPDWNIPNVDCLFLSINRYERKKNLPLALNALGQLQDKLGSLSGKAHLIIAGGYDERVTENKEHYLELRQLAKDLNVEGHVTFLRSFNDTEKLYLLSSATCLLYTPDREHFGIVPVEAMYMKCPVIAVNSGGPLETVSHEVTGYLCEDTPEEFCKIMMQFVQKPSIKAKLGSAGKDRMIKLFSFDTYTKHLSSIVDAMLSR